VADIFISYAREDQGRIGELVSALEQQGWSIFWDRRIPSGQTWRSYIGNSLDNARCVIVAWSRHSVNSTWVTEEADDGKRRGVLVPVLLDPVEQPRGFREIQAADLTDWEPGRPSLRFDELVKDIRGLLHSAQTRPSDKPVESPAVPRAREDRMGQSTPNAYSRRFVFAVATVVFVLGVIVVGYLSFRGSITDSPVSIPTPAQEAKSEPKPEEKKAESRPEPTTVVRSDTALERPKREQPSLFALRAVIDDPDGYTNVRSMKSASSDIVTKVHKGEEFYTYVQDGNWWEIRTKDGKFGYMHVSRIRILK
jgi:TIR domain